MKDKNNKIHIAVAMQDSAISFYDVTIHEDDILGIVSAEEYGQLQHESHANKKDLRAYIDKDGNRKIGAFDNTQPSRFHFWNEKKVDWDITEEKQAELDALEKQRKIQSLHDDLDNIERQITRLERIKKRTELEEQELDQLIDQSTELYRAIKEAEGEQA